MLSITSSASPQYIIGCDVCDACGGRASASTDQGHDLARSAKGLVNRLFHTSQRYAKQQGAAALSSGDAASQCSLHAYIAAFQVEPLIA